MYSSADGLQHGLLPVAGYVAQAEQGRTALSWQSTNNGAQVHCVGCRNEMRSLRTRSKLLEVRRLRPLLSSSVSNSTLAPCMVISPPLAVTFPFPRTKNSPEAYPRHLGSVSSLSFLASFQTPSMSSCPLPPAPLLAGTRSIAIAIVPSSASATVRRRRWGSAMVLAIGAVAFSLEHYAIRHASLAISSTVQEPPPLTVCHAANRMELFL